MEVSGIDIADRQIWLRAKTDCGVGIVAPPIAAQSASFGSSLVKFPSGERKAPVACCREGLMVYSLSARAGIGEHKSRRF